MVKQSDSTTIRLDKSTKKLLKELAVKDQSYDYIINQLITFYKANNDAPSSILNHGTLTPPLHTNISNHDEVSNVPCYNQKYMQRKKALPIDELTSYFSNDEFENKEEK